MSFWDWFKRPRRPVQATSTAAYGGSRGGAAAAAVLDEPEPTGPPAENENTAPMLQEVSRRAAAASARRAAEYGWPERDEIADLGEGRDETQLAHVIGRTAPNAGPAEVLFRYHLSRLIYFGGHELPPLPSSSAKILELSRSPKSGVSDYVKVIETDPGLVRSVLWLANSSFYGAMVKCTSLAQAMVRIGIREVERIALMQAFQARVFRVYGQDELVRELTSHGLATALAAQDVVCKEGGSPPDAFLGGLFHDVGKLVVLGVVAQVQRQLKRRAPQALIQSAFDAFHVAVGEAACRHWEMPESLIQAVAHHQDAELAAPCLLDRAVYLGNLITHTLKDKTEPDIIAPGDVAAAAAGLGTRELREVREQVIKQLKEYQQMVG